MSWWREEKTTGVCDRTHRQEVDGCVVAPLILATPIHPRDRVFYLNPGVLNFTAASRGPDQLKQPKTVYVVKAFLDKLFIWKKVDFTILSNFTKNVYKKKVKLIGSFSRLFQVFILLFGGISEVFYPA